MTVAKRRYKYCSKRSQYSLSKLKGVRFNGKDLAVHFAQRLPDIVAESGVIRPPIA